MNHIIWLTIYIYISPLPLELPSHPQPPSHPSRSSEITELSSLCCRVSFLSLHAQLFSHVWLFASTWTVAHQAPLCVGFSRQEYWSGLPFPPLGVLPDPGIEPCLLHWQVYSLPLSHLGSSFSHFSLAIYFTHGSVYMSKLLSQCTIWFLS